MFLGEPEVIFITCPRIPTGEFVAHNENGNR